MRARSAVTIAFCGFLVPLAAHAANLVKDSSFELPAVPAGNLTRYSNGDMIGPWVVVGASGTVDVISTTFTYDGFTFNAKLGKQWLDLTGASQTATGVAQTIATTVGAKYQLKFFVGSVYDTGGTVGTTSTVHVMNGGKQIFKAIAKGTPGLTTQTWRPFSVTFTATSAKTTLSFINGDPSNDTDCGLDGVSLSLVSGAPDSTLVESLRNR